MRITCKESIANLGFAFMQKCWHYLIYIYFFELTLKGDINLHSHYLTY